VAVVQHERSGGAVEPFELQPRRDVEIAGSQILARVKKAAGAFSRNAVRSGLPCRAGISHRDGFAVLDQRRLGRGQHRRHRTRYETGNHDRFLHRSSPLVLRGTIRPGRRLLAD